MVRHSMTAILASVESALLEGCGWRRDFGILEPREGPRPLIGDGSKLDISHQGPCSKSIQRGM
jgi:hypothetical protein